MELVIASSSVDAGISCWDLHSGAEQPRYRSCASTSHGLISVGQSFLASSQVRDSSSSSGSILYWFWDKQRVEVRSFPAEQIQSLVSDSEGTYIIGGGLSGDIYLWEVASGRLLKKWHGHFKAVTCLVFPDDESLLISGSEDGAVKVWSLFKIFDDIRRAEEKHLFEHNFSEHTLRVTDIVCGHGGCNAVIVSASEDQTCKIWSLSKGKLLREIKFPSVIAALALDPGEEVFYAGSRNGNIYIAALTAESTSKSSFGMHIIGSLSDHRNNNGVTCLAFGTDGIQLISGSEDGMIRVWDTKTRNIIRILKHGKDPVNNILVIESPNPQPSLRKHGSSMAPPLEKYMNSADEIFDRKTFISPRLSRKRPLQASYLSYDMINSQCKELQRQGSSAATEMELERMKLEYKKAMQNFQQLKKMHEDLQTFCVNEVLKETSREM